MATDSTNRGGRSEEGSLLPGIVSVRVRLARYAKPKRYFNGLQPLDAREGVEVLIETTEELPIRAATPVAFIGNVVPNHAEAAGPRLYRFFFFDLGRLKPGAPISFGFPNAPQFRIRTDFSYNPGQPPLMA